MANEIYNTTWWGNAIDTAITAGTEPDFFGSQMKMLTSQQPELVVNGDFATDSDWTKGTGWTISGGTANCNGTINQSLLQTNVFTIGKKYKINFTISNVVGGLAARIWMATGPRIEVNSDGNYTTYWVADQLNLYITTLSTNTATYSIDNVSVKLARAEEVEAVKCLADWIHTTALQDLNN